MCSASIPNWVEKIYKEYEENEHLTGQNQLSLLVAYEQIRILKENGVNHFHLYTLNKYETASNISRIIRLFN
jgi:5,10-methylenetetrahydrofolate reductase